VSCGCCFGVEGGELRFGDDGLDAALESKALTRVESPHPESRLVADELCLLKEGVATVGGVKGQCRADCVLEFVGRVVGRLMNILVMAEGEKATSSTVLSRERSLPAVDGRFLRAI